MKKQVIAITGASGFIGSELVRKAPECIVTINFSRATNSAIDKNKVADFRSIAQLATLLKDVDTVVHLAGPAHTKKYQNDLGFYDREVTENSLNLFAASVQAGVKHFIFASSVKVYGEATQHGISFNEDSTTSPISFYGVAKLNAESRLQESAKTSGTKLSIIRFPPVYGLHAKGSIRWFLRLSRISLPLPISNINSSRSLLYVGNAVKLIYGLACGELESGLYCPSDEPLMTVGEFYKDCWRLISPAPWLLKFIPCLPGFLYDVLSRCGILTQLFSSFVIQSKHRDLFRKIGFLDSRSALAEIQRQLKNSAS